MSRWAARGAVVLFLVACWLAFARLGADAVMVTVFSMEGAQ